MGADVHPTAPGRPSSTEPASTALSPGPGTERTDRDLDLDDDHDEELDDDTEVTGADAVTEPRTDGELVVPERDRFCGSCGAPVGRSANGRPGVTEGTCSECSTPYSFVPRLHRGDLVAGRYEILRPLAHGGVSWTYLAEDTHLDRKVVLKGLINAADADALRAAENERKSLVALSHRNIVTIIDKVEIADPPTGHLVDYIVMEYLHGRTLQQIKESAEQGTGALPVRDVLEYGARVLDALGYLHRRGWLYCDLKPDNVIRLTSDGSVKLIDMGAVCPVGYRGPIWGTKGYRVGDDEIVDRREITVDMDLYTVGRTLRALFDASHERCPADDQGAFATALESLDLLIARATHRDWMMRFWSAEQMSRQLDGVLWQVVASSGGEPPPIRSTLFGPVHTLLGGDLGKPPALEHWTSRPAGPESLRPPRLSDGRPAPWRIALGLPESVPDRTDPAADFLSGITTTDAGRLLTELSTFDTPSIEVQLHRARAHLEQGAFGEAERDITVANRIAGTGGDWRVIWHRALVALAAANGSPAKMAEAEKLFTMVRAALPGELAPRLALGFCAEYGYRFGRRGHERDQQVLACRDRAITHYQLVWQTDPAQVSAAFGLARMCLARHDPDAAVAVLDQVRPASAHYDAARTAAVKIRAGLVTGSGVPGVDDLADAVTRLGPADLDRAADTDHGWVRLLTAVRQAGLDWVRCGHGSAAMLPAGSVFGEPVTERGLRRRLDTCFRYLAARQAGSENQHGTLVDLANTVRPRTRW